jgi:putative addiction module component (TIGR02574 family)
MAHMARTLSKEEIFELSAEARLHLIKSLWDSLSPDEVPVPEGHRKLIEQRLEDHRRNPDQSVSWEELEGELFPR